MSTALLPDIELARTLPRGTDVLVAGLAAGTVVGVPDPAAKAVKKAYGVDVATLAAALGAKDKASSITVLPKAGSTTIILVGLGDGPISDVDTARLRSAAGAGVRAAAGLPEYGAGRVAIGFERSEPDAVGAIAEGGLLGSYAFRPLHSGAAEPAAVTQLTVLTKSTAKAQLAAVEAAGIVARAVVANREWVNQPANLLYPQSFAEQVQAHVGARSKVSVEVLDESALERGGYGGLLAVGGGSQRPPRLVRLSYRPRGAKFHLGLVGKGVTFDSGGLDIKTQTGMYTMKSDMSGAAAVFATVNAIAELGLKIKVTGYGSLAENMPSGSAYRPSDVLTIYGGTTVENVNTDAEGRLVMADALARISAEDKPDLLIDVATLTGACIMALGDRTAGVLGDDASADEVLAAADQVGERFWRLPIVEESRGFLDSDVADLKSGRSGPGGAMTAAAFLREFTAELPWAHLDVAGPAFNSGSAYDEIPAGGTGFGVRTLIEIARRHS